MSWVDRGWKLVYRGLEHPGIWEWSRVTLVAETRRLIASLLPFEPGMRVLDVCSGTASFCMPRAGVTYVGVDLEVRYVSYAARRWACYPGCFFVAGDVTALPFHQQAFSDVLWIYSLHHTSDDQARGILRSLAEARPRRLLLIDVIGDHLRGLKRILAARDRGKYIRPVEMQRQLIQQDWTIQRQGSIRHRVILDGVYYLCTPRA